jgi:hypothetical protein
LHTSLLKGSEEQIAPSVINRLRLTVAVSPPSDSDYRRISQDFASRLLRYLSLSNVSPFCPRKRVSQEKRMKNPGPSAATPFRPLGPSAPCRKSRDFLILRLKRAWIGQQVAARDTARNARDPEPQPVANRNTVSVVGKQRRG